VLDLYRQNLLVLGGKSCSSCREPGSDICILVYKWTHCRTHTVFMNSSAKVYWRYLNTLPASNHWSAHVPLINSREWARCCDGIQWVRYEPVRIITTHFCSFLIAHVEWQNYNYSVLLTFKLDAVCCIL
jgi:hypothetical protein